MIIKQANSLINVGSIILRVAIVFYCAVLLAKLTWWIITPSVSDIYAEKSDVAVFDKSGKFIINRSPFGKVVAPPTPPKPAIVSHMKLTGVYFNTLKDSIVFYELNNKSYIAKVGDTIGNTAILKSITPSGIILTENNTDAEVNMSGGSAVVQPLTRPSSNSNNNQNNSFLSNNYPTSTQQNPSVNNSFNRNSGNYVEDYGTQSSDNLADKRRKLIEEFAQRRSNSESIDNKGSNSILESR